MPGGDRVNLGDYHEVLKIAGGVAALLLFIPMAVLIAKENGAGQSGATWMLWAALDLILTISLARQHGNFLLPLGFAIGDLVLVAQLVAQRQFRWTRFETIVFGLVLGCLTGWFFGGSRAATLSTTLAVCVAAVPGLVALWRNPQRKVGNVWAGYVAANGLSFFGGSANTVEERFAPAVFALCALVMFAASRRNGLWQRCRAAPSPLDSKL